MNLNIWQQVRWLLTEETLLHCYSVTLRHTLPLPHPAQGIALLHCTNIFSRGSVILLYFPNYLPDFKHIIYTGLLFRGFKIVTTHELGLSHE
jgi:hypothetical protein